MRTTSSILLEIESAIKDQKEKSYFWTHEVRYKFILEQIQKIAGDKKLVILDIGCFPYHIGKALEIMGHDVYGIASAHEPIKNKNIEVLNIEKDKFTFKDNFFDIVLFNEVIEHLPQSPIIPLKEIHRVTKKEGLLMITTPNITRSINRIKILFGKTIMYPIDVYLEENGKGNNIYHRHNREYTLNELKSLAEKTSWKVQNADFFISYTPFRKREKRDSPFLFTGKLINYFLMLLIPSFQDNLYILAEK